MSTPIQVEIDHSKFWTLAGGQPIHMNVSVFAELRKHGIPVEGGVEFRAVTAGRICMWNEMRSGKRFCIYEWTPPTKSFDDDEDEL